MVYCSNSRESFEFIIKNFHKIVASIDERVKIVILRLQEPGDDEISIDEGIHYSQGLGVYHMQIVCKHRNEIIEVLRIVGRDILPLI